MSTQRECYLVVGNFLEDIFSIHKKIAEEKGEDFSYEDIYDFRDNQLSDMYEGACGFIGYKFLDDYETLYIDEYGSYPEILKLKEDFEEVTGVKAKIKPIIYSY